MISLRKTLLTVEIALTVILLVCGGLLFKRFLRLRSVDLGCTTKNVVTMEYFLHDAKYDSPEKMGTLHFSELKITRLGSDAALVIGRWKLDRKTDKPHGRFTLLFRRTPAGWRIVHDHSS